MEMKMNMTMMPMPMPMQLIVSCLGIFVFTILFEVLKGLRSLVWRRLQAGESVVSIKLVHKVCSCSPCLCNPCLCSSKQSQKPGSVQSVQLISYSSENIIVAGLFSCLHLCGAAAHMIQVVFGYLLMLVVMTYNGWLGLAVILGSGIGYFLIAWKSS